MNKCLYFFAIVANALARPQDLLEGNDGHVSVTQSSSGTYKYAVHLKDSTRSEERLEDGTVNGEYTIPDANGAPLTIKYTSGKDGFRILEGPMPKAPVDITIPVDNTFVKSSVPIVDVPIVPVDTVVPVVDDHLESLAARTELEVPLTESLRRFAPVPLQHVVGTSELNLPVDYTPEVKAAREEFFAAHRAAATTTVV